MVKIEVVGRLTKKPIKRTSPNDVIYCYIDIAATVRGDKNPMYFSFALFENDAENAIKYLDKGSLIFVSGDLKIEEYECKDGSKGLSKKIDRPDVEYLSTKEKNEGESTDEV